MHVMYNTAFTATDVTSQILTLLKANYLKYLKYQVMAKLLLQVSNYYLPVSGIQFMSEILPRLYFWLLNVTAADFRASAYRKCKEALFWSHVLYAPIFAWKASWTSWFQHGLLFFHYSPHQDVSLSMPEQQMKLQLFWIAATPPPCPLNIPGYLQTRTIRSVERYFLHLCAAGPHILFGWTPWSCTLV